MSWMDSWSRPSKSQAVPPPLYLTSGSEQVPYCHTCGRVISTRRSHNSSSSSSPVKYCSDRCRHNKPADVDRKIEDAFVALLNDDLDAFRTRYGMEVQALGGAKPQGKRVKGDPRIVVLCSHVEELIFGSRFDPARTAGRRKDRAPRGAPDPEVWRSVDMEDSPPPPVNSGREAKDRNTLDTDGSESEDSEHGGIDLTSPNLNIESDHIRLEVDPEHKLFGAGKRRPAQENAEVNGSVGGEKGWAEKTEESSEMLQKRREGQKRAEEKEMVRRAARRGVAFGFAVEEKAKVQHEVINKAKGRRKQQDVEEEILSKQDTSGGRKKCEAVMTKAMIVVETSYAKGDWGIRWREDA
ncbi:hypothetical protein BP6252_02822 [Coleophoma cylindrospora]|uniref:Uncharacterized protein n=1 Tax=Coleophoma cylindrospora TaxID=1849047 RepID=A0A3D8SFZ4_9HELO|nr:hypothetical protein BP6252_02822 [Coleophoma cylindrospora]